MVIRQSSLIYLSAFVAVTTLLSSLCNVAQAQRSPLISLTNVNAQTASETTQRATLAQTRPVPISSEPSWAPGTIDLYSFDASVGGHTRPVYSVAFSPDNNYLASGGADRTVKIWSLTPANATQLVPSLYVTLQNGNAQVISIAFSSNGQLLATGSLDGTVRIWNWRNRQLLYTFSLHTDKVETVVFSPDGQVLASAGGDKTIRFWNVATGTLIREIESEQWITSLAFSPDGTRLISSGLGRRVEVWNWQQGRQLESFGSYSSPIYAIALSPDGQAIAFSPNSVSPGAATSSNAVTDRNTIHLLNLEGEAVIEPLAGHTDYIRTLTFSPSGRFLLSGSWDNTIKLWDLQTGQLFRNFADITAQRVLSVAFSPNGRMFACGSGDASVQLFVSIETR
ncbi:WD40 repeat domain-containing protein [Oscillatoria sp. FACHB-1407]|uniref:WD40 repeat domain-containing protein n=1 Tax=Oscillatoria sp. FACHB-1407 TaxID=2692847 RepID=UPI001688FCA6|nr:WD40 repeat domain-containing protein [Oscillatoria sp. FACHB-1407]MBD2464610.1 WD40 repeat domain-containing protein [Oscillatoria sp. FACHB-1407]